MCVNLGEGQYVLGEIFGPGEFGPGEFGPGDLSSLLSTFCLHLQGIYIFTVERGGKII